MKSNRSIPDAVVIPVLQYEDVPKAVAWLARAFGFRERLRIGDHRVQMLVDGGGALVVANGEGEPRGQSILLRVEDVDAVCRRAQDAGALVAREPQDHPYGERQCTILDPFGHAWTLTQSIADVDPATWGGELV